MGITTNSLLNRAVALLSPDLTYIGVGTGAPISNASTLLNTENSRKAVTTLIDENVMVKEVYYDTTELNGVAVTTVGLFGQGATASINTGVLMFGDNITINKTNLESLTISCEITVEGV